MHLDKQKRTGLLWMILVIVIPGIGLPVVAREPQIPFQASLLTRGLGIIAVMAYLLVKEGKKLRWPQPSTRRICWAFVWAASSLFLGAQAADPAIALAIVALTPLLTYWLLSRQNRQPSSDSWRATIGIVLGLLIFFASYPMQPGPGLTIGIVVLMGAAGCNAWFYHRLDLQSKIPTSEKDDDILLMFWLGVYLAGFGGCQILARAFVGDFVLPVSAELPWRLLYIGLIYGALYFYANLRGFALLGAEVASPLAQLELLAVMGGTYLLNQVPIRPISYLGGLIVVLAAAVLVRKR